MLKKVYEGLNARSEVYLLVLAMRMFFVIRIAHGMQTIRNADSA